MILIYAGNRMDPEVVRELLHDQPVHFITEEEWSKPVEAVLKEPVEGEPFRSPKRPKALLFFENADPQEAFALQDRLVSAGMESPMLAGLTEHNGHRSLENLMEEYIQEEGYATLFSRLSQLLYTRVDRERMNSDDAYADMCIEAAHALQGEPSMEELERIVQNLEKNL